MRLHWASTRKCVSGPAIGSSPCSCVVRAMAQPNAVAMHHHGLCHIHDCLQSYVHRGHVSTVCAMFLCVPNGCMHVVAVHYGALGLYKVSLNTHKYAT